MQEPAPPQYFTLFELCTSSNNILCFVCENLHHMNISPQFKLLTSSDNISHLRILGPVPCECFALFSLITRQCLLTNQSFNGYIFNYTQ